MEYKIDPCTKPRMTRSDRWKVRPATTKYWAFKDEVKRLWIELAEEGKHITFIIPMPKSWSKKKKLEMDWKPHQQTPDKDNLEKALMDAIYDDDCRIWDSRVSKRWGREWKITITNIEDAK